MHAYRYGNHRGKLLADGMSGIIVICRGGNQSRGVARLSATTQYQNQEAILIKRP